jgi:hypothetical protein
MITLDRYRRRLDRCAALGSSLVAGVMLATLTLPAADHMQDNVTASAGIDAG